jgi:LysW-gamma-L-lysine/LysW-L-ornithine aminotransferase
MKLQTMPAEPTPSPTPWILAAEERHLARSFPPKPVTFERGREHMLYAPDGTAYIDLGGASHGVANFGHSHPRITQAIQEQAARLTYTAGTIPSRPRAEMLERLHRLLPGHLTRTFLSNSGAEAMEAALKHAAVRTSRTRFVAMRSSFHGRTLGALAATFRPQYRKPFEALLPQVDFAPLNDEAALEAAVTKETAAVLVEVVQGEGGLAVGTDSFLRAAQRIAHDNGALLVIDEVQTGLGRTGRDLAIHGTGVRPDIVTLGKSLAGGLPVGATAMTEEVASAMPAGGHGTTFGGSPLVCAAACAALDVLREERLSERAEREGEAFQKALRDVKSPQVREVRGRGLMVGVDLRVRAQGVLDGLLQRRKLALAAGPTVVRFLPPLAIPGHELHAAAADLEAILGEVES